MILPRYYLRSMKVKTSISLSRDVLAAVDRLARTPGARSGVIESCLREYFQTVERRRSGLDDIERIKLHATELNAEMADALSYQAFPRNAK